MDFLKNLTFTIALILVGAVFVLIGITGGIPFGSQSLVIKGAPSQIALSLLGVLLIGVAIYLEFVAKRGLKRDEATGSTSGQSMGDTKKSADDFLYTLANDPSGSFPDWVQGACQVSILGRTAVNLLNLYRGTFEELAHEGCIIRLLLVDPDSDASCFVYGDSSETYRNHVNTVIAHLKYLSGRIGNRLQTRVIKHAPTLGVLIVEKSTNSESFTRVQLFLYSRVGGDRPVFQVNRSDRWYDVFVEEFEQLWSRGCEWDDSRSEKWASAKKAK